MTSINITAEQAAILDSGDQSKSDPLARQLRYACQELANQTGATCEVYHPEGFVWDSAVAEALDEDDRRHLIEDQIRDAESRARPVDSMEGNDLQ